MFPSPLINVGYVTPVDSVFINDGSGNGFFQTGENGIY